MHSIQVKNLNHLKRLCRNKSRKAFILSNYNIRSTKYIIWKNKQFEVFNLIDSTEQTLSLTELYTRNNIGMALEQKSLFIESLK